jgi:hypothetical protein
MLTITPKTVSDEGIENLAKKLHPSNFTAMSSKMAAIVAFVLGKEWTNPSINWMSVSSDGFVSTDSDFLGTENSLKENFSNLVKAAELTEEESIDFRILCQKIDNWY